MPNGKRIKFIWHIVCLRISANILYKCINKKAACACASYAQCSMFNVFTGIAIFSIMYIFNECILGDMVWYVDDDDDDEVIQTVFIVNHNIIIPRACNLSH